MGIYVFNPLLAYLAEVLGELALPLRTQLPPGGPASIGPAIDLKTITPPRSLSTWGGKSLLLVPMPLPVSSPPTPVPTAPSLNSILFI